MTRPKHIGPLKAASRHPLPMDIQATYRKVWMQLYDPVNIHQAQPRCGNCAHRLRFCFSLFSNVKLQYRTLLAGQIRQTCLCACFRVYPNRSLRAFPYWSLLNSPRRKVSAQSIPGCTENTWQSCKQACGLRHRCKLNVEIEKRIAISESLAVPSRMPLRRKAD